MTAVGWLRRRRECGMVTAELAATLPAVVFVLTVLLNAVAIGIDQVRCVDAARAAARVAARGDGAAQARTIGARAAPEGARIRVTVRGGRVQAAVQADVPGPFGWLIDGRSLGASVVAVRERGAEPPA